MIGIDISELSLKIVQLSNDKQQRLLHHCLQPVPPGVVSQGVVQRAAELQQVVRKGFAACHLPIRIKDAVAVSIPETQSFLRVIEVPQMNEDEMGEAVQWEVAQHIPFGLENVYIDWQPLASGHRAAGGRAEVVVGAAQRKVVDSLYQALSVLGLDLAVFELESQALVRALVNEKLKQKQGVLLVDVGSSSTNVIIHDHGTMRFTASLSKGADYTFAALSSQFQEAAKNLFAGLSEAELGRVGEQLRPLLDELVTEVRGIEEFYNSIDAQHTVREILITGGGSNLPGMEAAFLRYFPDVLVQRGNPWVNLLSGLPNVQAPMEVKDSVRYTTALGLALRPVVV